MQDYDDEKSYYANLGDAGAAIAGYFQGVDDLTSPETLKILDELETAAREVIAPHLKGHYTSDDIKNIVFSRLAWAVSHVGNAVGRKLTMDDKDLILYQLKTSWERE